MSNPHDIVASRAVERLLAIDWTANPERAHSQMILLMEYLRRAVLWSKALGTIDAWPIFNIAGRACPGAPVPQQALQRLSRSPAGRQADQLRALTCQHYLRWEAAKHLPCIAQFDLPDPFEPLILAYERGGGFTREGKDNTLHLGWIAVLPESWPEYDRDSPFVELDPVMLDLIDQAEEEI